MADTSARILRLLSLLQARSDWPGAALADRLGISVRTLRRDVETLRDLGYPVEAGKGPGGGYRLGPGGKLPPLVLDDDQAIAIALALQTAPATVRGIDDAVARALTTLRQVLPARLRAASEAFEVSALRNYWGLRRCARRRGDPAGGRVGHPLAARAAVRRDDRGGSPPRTR